MLGGKIASTEMEQAMESARVTRDGALVASPLTGDDRTDPVVSLRYLFQHAEERAIPLRRGEIVTTGAVVTPFDVAASCNIHAHYLNQTLFAAAVFDR